MPDVSTPDATLSTHALQLLRAGLKFPDAKAPKDEIFGLGANDLIAAAIKELRQAGHLQEHWQLEGGHVARYFIFCAVPLLASGNPLHLNFRTP